LLDVGVIDTVKGWAAYPEATTSFSDVYAVVFSFKFAFAVYKAM
jgi:hypothetical protein